MEVLVSFSWFFFPSVPSSWSFWQILACFRMPPTFSTAFKGTSAKAASATKVINPKHRLILLLPENAYIASTAVNYQEKWPLPSLTTSKNRKPILKGGLFTRSQYLKNTPKCLIWIFMPKSIFIYLCHCLNFHSKIGQVWHFWVIFKHCVVFYDACIISSFLWCRMSTFLKLFVAFGLTWVFEVVAWLISSDRISVPMPLQILLNIANVLQGLIIFFVFGLKRQGKGPRGRGTLKHRYSSRSHSTSSTAGSAASTRSLQFRKGNNPRVSTNPAGRNYRRSVSSELSSSE